MRITAPEEYGIRCLLQVARAEGGRPVGIPAIAEAEGLSVAYAAKLLRQLRQGGLVRSVRGAAGGYLLARPAEEIDLWEVVQVLDGPLLPDGFCRRHAARRQPCDQDSCDLHALWQLANCALKSVFEKVSLADLLRGELSAKASPPPRVPAHAGSPEPLS